jgi:hypothetical protein
MAKVIRFPAYVDLRQRQTPPTLRERFVRWFQDPPKAPIFEIKNPTHWKLEAARRKARGLT